MPGINRDSSDDELYDWLIRDAAQHGSAVETEPGVIQVVIHPDDEDDEQPRTVQIHITRQQLRKAVKANAKDGREALGIRDPVHAGWALFSVHVDEDLMTLGPDEHFLVWHRGRLWPSVQPNPPPVRGRLEEPRKFAPDPQAYVRLSQRRDDADETDTRSGPL